MMWCLGYMRNSNIVKSRSEDMALSSNASRLDSFHIIASVDVHKLEKKEGVLLSDPGVVDMMSSLLKQGRRAWRTLMYIVHVKTSYLGNWEYKRAG